jgi:hypothetical protein
MLSGPKTASMPFFSSTPDEIAGLHQLVVDQILRPRLSDDEEVAADVSREVHLRIGRIEVDDRDARCARFLDDVDKAARIGAGCDDGVGLSGDGGSDRLLLRGHVAIVE